jgi:pilus assembly protein CpaE
MILVRLDIKDMAIKEEFERQVSLIEGYTLIESSHHCDLLILEISPGTNIDLDHVTRIQDSREANVVFLTARDPDPHMLISAMRAGVREFFPQPLKRDDLHAALVKLKRDMIKEEIRLPEIRSGQLVSVFGTKGGVGTTTIAVNLATSLGRLEGSPKVALIDMNLLFGEVSIFLDLKPIFDWAEVARNIARMDATYLSGILLNHHSGINVLPSPVKAIEEYHVTPNIIEELLKLMVTMFDYIIVDGGQMLGSISRFIIAMSDKLLLVTIPSLPGVINAKRFLETLSELDYPDEDSIVVMNRYNQKSGISIIEAQKAINRTIKWTIPNDYRSTMSAINNGEPLTSSALSADITKKIIELASFVAGREESKKKVRKGLFG